jgi:squalene-hopene/tetraprenyl-beta-curcumene cyclase
MSMGSFMPDTSSSQPSKAEPATTGSDAKGELTQHAERALSPALDELLRQQAPEGDWCAELEGDSVLQSEYILLKWIIRQEDDPRLPRIANYLRKQQRASDGAWVQYPGAGPDLSATAHRHRVSWSTCHC